MGNNTQANVSYSNEVFKQYILQLSTGLVWKNQVLANANESSDIYDRYRAELFVLANRNLLTFQIVRAFPRIILQNVFGASDPSIDIYASDKNKIPTNSRDVVVTEYQNALKMKNPRTGNYSYWDNINSTWITIYDESNNYYRMLMGLPDIGDTDYIYNTDSRWSMTTPIHEMTITERYEMEDAGILDELYAAHPDKEYLKFIGRRRVDFFTARTAEQFSLLWKNNSASDALNDGWDACYENCRRMITTVYYSNAFKQSHSLYNNFIAMAILFATIQQMQYLYLKTDSTRDFYDVESLKVVYDSYGVPFFEEIPISYHKKIVKNINHLIANKGSDNVFFDLFKIFDFGSMKLYNYFLVKKHITDESGNPVFRLKYGEYVGGFIIDDDSGLVIDLDDCPWYEPGIPLCDDKGRPIISPDSYEWTFSKVEIGEDPALSIANSENSIPYDDVIQNDPYWVEDDDLKEAKSNENINFIESKYMGVQIIFDMLKIAYENAYIFRMIMDNSELTKKLRFSWAEIGFETTFFDIFIYLACIVCQLFGYDAIIDDKLPAVVDTLGYNFEHITDILDVAQKNRYTTDISELYTLINQMNFGSAEDITNNYENILKIQDLLIRGYSEATSIEEFDAYMSLYKSLLVSKEVTTAYLDPYGYLVDDDMCCFEVEDPENYIIAAENQIFPTFQLVLEYNNSDLMQRYILISDDETLLQNELDLVIAKLEESLSCIKYLSFSTGVNSSILINTLFKILTFFKSAKAELLDHNITFVIRRRGINFFKFLDYLYASEGDTVSFDDQTWADDFIDSLREELRLSREELRHVEEFEDAFKITYITEHISMLSNYIKSIVEDPPEQPISELIAQDDMMDRSETNGKVSEIHQMNDLGRVDTLYELINGQLTSVT